MNTKTAVGTQHNPYMLRVRSNSEMFQVIKAAMEHDGPISDAELQEAGGHSRSHMLIRWLDQWFDNVRVERDGLNVVLHYQDVQPRPVAVAADVTPVAGEVASTPEAEHIEDIRWPQAPPIIESLGDVFREPTWFKTMRKMVENGRHIALAGPPGVGKDTCVQELAARTGHILVTVGGDAGFRRRDLVGTTQISKGSSFLDVAEYATAVVSGWWALVTEVNAADADALMFMNSQMAPPYTINIGGKAYPVHPDFRLFVTYNPGLTGTKPLPQSFKDRFFSIKIPFFTEAQLMNLLVAHGMPEDASWARTVTKYGTQLWDAHERGSIRYQVTSRRLQDAVVLMNTEVCTDVKDALKMAVVDSIDSPVEANTAKQILQGLYV